MLYPVCVSCSIEMKPKHIGSRLFEMANFGVYKIWSADVYECPACHHEITFGHGASPQFIHHEPGFEHIVQGILKDAECCGEQVIYDYESIEQRDKMEGLGNPETFRDESIHDKS